MSRHYGNWLLKWCELFKDTEVPESFAVWAGIWTISAVLQDHVALARGGGSLYPNMYIMLIGPPRGGKSYPSSIALEQFIEPNAIETWAGNMSPSFMTKYLDAIALKAAATALPGVLPRPALTFYSDELALTLGSSQQAGDVLRILTQLYDFRFDYGTHAHGVLRTGRPLLNWLACTTVRWLRRSIPPDLIDSGFCARLIAQVEPLRDVIVPELPPIDPVVKQQLLDDLAAIAALTGRYKLTQDAQFEYNKWYIENRQRRIALDDEIIQNIYGREDEHVLKVAICLMASVGDSFDVLPSAITSAITLVEGARQSNIELFRGIAAGDKMLDLKMYLQGKILSTNGPVSHSQLQRSTNKVIPDATMFKQIIESLIEEQMIERVPGAGKGQHYRKKA